MYIFSLINLTNKIVVIRSISCLSTFYPKDQWLNVVPGKYDPTTTTKDPCQTGCRRYYIFSVILKRRPSSRKIHRGHKDKLLKIMCLQFRGILFITFFPQNSTSIILIIISLNLIMNFTRGIRTSFCTYSQLNIFQNDFNRETSYINNTSLELY